MTETFIKICYSEFKKNDTKFPDDWTLDDYKKYTEECNRILEKYDLNIIRKYEEDVHSIKKFQQALSEDD